MHVLLDHLGATLGAAAVVFLLIAAGLSQRSGGVSTSVRYGDLRRFEAFTETVERDLAAGAAIDQAAVAGGVYGLDVHTDPETGATARVEYREVPVSGGVRLGRFVDGAPEGESPLLASWSVESVDREGAPTPPHVATGLTVRLDAVQGNVARPDTARWARTLHPPGLGRTSF